MARKSQSNVTTDHDEIRRWVEERGGTPACVRGTGGDRDPGMIRIDFPGFSGEGSLEPISWEDWFRAFDENNLAFLHQDSTAGGERSNFNKLIARETAQRRARGERAASVHRRGRTTRATSSRRRSSRSRSAAASRSRRSSRARTTARKRGKTEQARTRQRSARGKSSRNRGASAGSSRSRRATSRRTTQAQSRSNRRKSSSRGANAAGRTRKAASQSNRGKRGKVLVARSKIRRLKKDVNTLDRRAA